MATRSPLINVMTRAADKAARGLKRDFGEAEQVQVALKGPADFVSNADIKAERTLRTELAKARPGFGFLMEESGTVAGSDPRHRWIIDPLDGTSNFLHGLPHFAISIALRKNDRVVLGVVHEVAHSECFHAIENGKAYCNQSEIHVSPITHLNESLLATGFPYYHSEKKDIYLDIIKNFLENTHGIRRLGS